MGNKGINAWAKELKHNEKFAKQYEGVSTVKGILDKAKSQGYNFNERDLADLDLDAVAGGFGKGFELEFDFDIDSKIAEVKQKIQGDGNQQTSLGDITIN